MQTEPTTIRVTNVQTGEAGVIVDHNDNGRVKVLVRGTKVVYYARKDVGNVLKRRHTRIVY